MAVVLRDNNSNIGPNRLQFALDAFSVASQWDDLQGYDERTIQFPCYPAELSVWHQVNSELKSSQTVHDRYWWSRHSGKALAVLLYNAGYSRDVQYRDLKFFAQVVAPHLGASQDPSIERKTRPWPSFMTDDGTPLELSWDWGTKDTHPTIRYSIEPIGLHAGTSHDPHNLAVGPAFQNYLEGALPGMGLELFQYFFTFFNSDISYSKDSKDDHQSSIFYAFDLAATEVTAKVYFFPKMRAQARNQSSLEVILEAINTIPNADKADMKACEVFRDFTVDKANKDIEYEMLAIDLINPLESRLKIYFRCRNTSFNSVINIMTIGGRVRNSKLYAGLVDLHRLWKALFGIKALDEPLPGNGHRTAGILYNVEFKVGDSVPVAKVYLPVRHYAKSDAAVIQSLNDYFQYRRRGKYMPDYVKAMNTLFPAETLRERSGVQTYLGCAIKGDGSLRLVSYFKPQIPEHLFSDEGSA